MKKFLDNWLKRARSAQKRGEARRTLLDEGGREGPPLIEDSWWAVNLMSGGLMLSAVLLSWPSWQVTPMWRTPDRTLELRLEELEERFRRNPRDAPTATELARLWQELGQPSWSYAALLEAERLGEKDALTRLALGSAYLDLGEPDDAKRVLGQAKTACERASCPSALRFKIDLFLRVADILIQEGIRPRSQLVFYAKALQRVIKQVELSMPHAR